jgi:hypothetical protein
LSEPRGRNGPSRRVASALRQTLAEAELRLGARILLIAAHIELIHVAGAIHELLVQLELASLRLRLRLGHRDPSFARLELGLDDLILRFVDALLILVAQVDVELGDLEYLHANIG